MFENLRASINHLLTDSIDKPTGLENVPLDPLVDLVLAKGAFLSAREQEALLTANWSEYLLNERLFTDPAKRPFVDALSQVLIDKPVIELGAGDRAPHHHHLFTRLLGAADYTGVDQQNLSKDSAIARKSDMLRFLGQQPSNSAHVVAFGVFNEPLMTEEFLFPARSVQQSSGAHVEHEYLRRLVAEIRRVLPEEGLFFGTGLWPLGSIDTSQSYIERAGLVAHDTLNKVALDCHAGTRLAGHDPFFYTKPGDRNDV